MSEKRKVAYNTAVQAVARLGINFLGVVSVGVTTRYLGLNIYGQLTTATLFVALFSSLSEAGITITSIRELAEGKLAWDDVTGNVLTMRTLAGIVFAAVTMLAASLIYRDPAHHYVVLAVDYLTITTVMMTIQTSLTTTLSARLRNDLVMVGAVAGRIVSLALIFAAVHYSWGFMGLIWATLAGAAVNFVSDVVFSITHGSARLKLRFHFPYWRHILLLAAPIGIASIINMLYLKIDGLMLSVLRSSQEVALYGVAYKLMDLLTTLPSFFTNSVFPVMVRAKDDPAKLKAVTERSVEVLDMVAAPIAVGSVVVAGHLARVLGGGAFAGAAWPMAILAVSNLFIYANAGYSTALFAMGRQKDMLRMIAIVFVANVALNAVAIPLFGTNGAATAVLLSEVLSLVMLIRIYRRLVGPALSPRRSWRYLALAGGMGLITWGAERWLFSAPTFINLLALAVVGAVSYGGLLLGTKQLKLNEIRSLVRPAG